MLTTFWLSPLSEALFLFNQHNILMIAVIAWFKFGQMFSLRLIKKFKFVRYNELYENCRQRFHCSQFWNYLLFANTKKGFYLYSNVSDTSWFPWQTKDSLKENKNKYSTREKICSCFWCSFRVRYGFLCERCFSGRSILSWSISVVSDENQKRIAITVRRVQTVTYRDTCMFVQASKSGSLTWP